MTTNDLFYLITGLMFVASGVAIFGFKKKALGLGVFGLAWVVMAIKDVVVPGSATDLLLHLAMAVVFLFHTGNTYRKARHV